MSKRLHQTMADYVVIAISPALIMALVGSLVFFLLQVLYRGEFEARLHWVMACFVFAAVLIGRISIEEGFERAAPFGIVLAIVVGIAMNRFVEVQGFWIENFTWLVNYALLGLVWWCAHRLTWDCTVIDDSQDASGEGLLQTAGLDSPAEPAKKELEPRQVERPEASIEGTTVRSNIPVGWWQRYVEHQRRPHAPGVWVVYFSLLALPLFGIGQWFIPASNVGGRRYAFWLLLVYVAAGLGLLLTTSFLGLRRYLRQRRIEMPTLMANLWLGIGSSLVVVLLIFAALLPRPSAEYSISTLPFQVGSPTARSSSAAPVPKEGTRDEQPGPAPDPQQQAPAANQSSGEPSGDSSQKGNAKSSGQEESKQGEPTRGQGEQKDQQPPFELAQAKQPQPARKNPFEDAIRQMKERQAEAARDRQQPSAKQQEPDKREPPQSQPPQGQQQQKQPAQPEAQAKPAPAQPQAPTSNPLDAVQPVVSTFGELVKWVFYGLVVLGTLIALWRYRQEVLRSIREFLAALRDLLDGLLGRRKPVRVGPNAEEVLASLPPPPFSSYADPFATGIAGRYSMEELVRYSFEAFEAWAREHGCPRDPDQTSHELARRVSARVAPMAPDARNIANLYSRAAYDRGRLPPESQEQLRQLWQHMRGGAARSLGN